MSEGASPTQDPPRNPGAATAGPVRPVQVVKVPEVVEAWSYRQTAEVDTFPRTPWGHRGYDELAVDRFVVEVSQDLTAADQEITDLRVEVDRLHRYIRRQWAAVAAAEAAGAQGGERVDSGAAASPAAQARAVLTQAQEIADRRLAQADERLAEADRLAAERLAHADRLAQSRLVQADELVSGRIAEADETAGQRLSRIDSIAEQVLSEAQQDAVARRVQAVDDVRQLLLLGRTRYEDIVLRAHQRADRAAEAALHEFESSAKLTDVTGRARVELELKAAYLRTFAKVSRAALQGALEVTAREFDRLLSSAHLMTSGAAMIAMPDVEPRTDQPRIDPARPDPARPDPESVTA
jgi:cell division septum initiation protein DivIVA